MNLTVFFKQYCNFPGLHALLTTIENFIGSHLRKSYEAKLQFGSNHNNQTSKLFSNMILTPKKEGKILKKNRTLIYWFKWSTTLQGGEKWKQLIII